VSIYTRDLSSGRMTAVMYIISPLLHLVLFTLASYYPYTPAQIIDRDKEYLVERILDERVKRVGRSARRGFLVKWTGYSAPT
jgi:hypothetical protein